VDALGKLPQDTPAILARSPVPTAPAADPIVIQPLPAPGTGQLNDNRQLRSIGTSRLSIAALDPTTKPDGSPKASAAAEAAQRGGLALTAARLGELGVVGALAAVAKAYTQTTFDPEAIGASLGKLVDNLQHVTGQLQALPGVGDALLALGGVGAIVSGVHGLCEGIAAAKSAEDTPEKVQASLGAAAGAAKIVGGLALALTPFCPTLGAIGAILTAAGTAMDAGRAALENRVPLMRALKGVQFGLASLVPPGAKLAIDQASRIVSNNSAAMVTHASG
jgi:hypothetical protein